MNNCLGCGRDCEDEFCDLCQCFEDDQEIVFVGGEPRIHVSLSDMDDESVSREEEIEEIIEQFLREATES